MLAFFFFSVLINFITGHGPECSLPIVHGTYRRCNVVSSTRYHFDPDLGVCHAFHYKGCGGNSNNYDTPGQCYYNCVGKPRKYFQCSLGDKPIVNKNGSPTCPLSDTGDGCDSDIAMCVNLETMGLCCNKTLELGFAADQTATCRSGKPRYLIDGDAMLGKIGEDFTCPTDYTPEEGNFFLTCCQK